MKNKQNMIKEVKAQAGIPSQAVDLLRINNLSVEYRVNREVVHAVNGISLAIKEGETLGLVGETGAGKTTTALSVIGLIPNPPGHITNGEIFLCGEDLLKKTEKEMRKIRGRKIAMIFQDPMTSLNPVLTVGHQIMEAYRLHNDATRDEAVRIAQKMLETVGISGDRYDEYPHQFSGGMKQRVMIAMALSCNPSLLIADEPTTALDVTIQAQILKLMGELKRNLNTAMLMITHDLGVVAEVCDNVAIMYAGEVIEYGTLRDVFKNMRHPYTEGLFQSIPHLNEEAKRLETIKGLMPDPSGLPSGCKFHPRCQKKRSECELNAPPAVNISATHQVRCFMYNKE